MPVRTRLRYQATREHRVHFSTALIIALCSIAAYGVNEAPRETAITGGRYDIVARSGAADEQGTCTLPGGKRCDADRYYGLSCTR